ncbi:hypothetical protein QN277_005897 [Acacia crassicarpa]|uniref:TIR domain-containing protein n=1 Tax=Acacia crassicarpa TaxID=499986 RepID=A0AAE1IX73_9FABA|nr:hypothetical protein QN277_005897 [Acacia crassicarpa]
MATQIAAQSSFGLSREIKYRYDVFLSFRGEDTRHSFTVLLYDALRCKGIKAFIDDKKLGKGERIAPALLKAIEKSRISIIVFSRNYATSTWCLDELAHIIRCKEQKNQVVMPIFYKVNPMDVQYQTNSFGEAMSVHEVRFRDNKEKLQKWRFALSEAARLSPAWLFEDGYQSGFIEGIAKHVYAMLPPKRFHNIGHMVGLETRIEEVMSLLDDSDDGACMLGIHGPGGIGKTTLAKAIYNSIFYQFEGSCFLFDVREESKKFHGNVSLQQTLLSEILEEKKMKFGSVHEGISKMKHRLSHKKVLLVLDDVDELEQIEELAGGCDWFGCGSKVIITTRNKQLLLAHNVENTYEMKELNDHDSLELFCSHAFHMTKTPKRYRDMSTHVISYARGIPLALRVIGSNLANKNLEEWGSILEKYDRIPESSIHEVLKISYDCLQDGAKSIFLDVACFFTKEILESVEEILEACHSGARFYIEVLVDKSLLAVDREGRLWMHDLIQSMGKEIVRHEAPSNPGKRSRIWDYKDILSVLHEDLGSNKIEGIMFDPPQQEQVEWSGMSFKKMDNLRILVVRNAQFSTGPKYFPNNLRWLEWNGYPCTTLPSDFSPRKLVSLRLQNSLYNLVEPFEMFEHVTCMDFSHCELITEVPNMSQCQSLRRLSLEECSNLIKVDDSVGFLSNLVVLNVRRCTKLTCFPHKINLPSLRTIYISGCMSLQYFPRIVGKMDSLTDIYAEETAIKELPPSVSTGNLPSLQGLFLRSCNSLGEIPSNLFAFPNLSYLDLGDTQPLSGKSFSQLMLENQSVISCTNLHVLDLDNCGLLLDEDLHLILKSFLNLENLDLSGSDIESLPECIKDCANLLTLIVSDCKKLRDIPELPPELSVIKAENCRSLTKESLDRLWSYQANRFSNLMRISMPATTTFPDWFDHCCKGGTLSFRVRENLPVLVLAVEVGKADTSRILHFNVSISINGCKIEMRKGRRPEESTEGHVLVFGLEIIIDLEEWNMFDKFLELGWNDVEIEFTSHDPPDMSIVNCGLYVNKLLTNMENIQF